MDRRSLRYYAQHSPDLSDMSQDSPSHVVTPAKPVVSTDARDRQRQSRASKYSQRSSTSSEQPQYCQNDLCQRAVYANDEEPGHGPRGIFLCRKCYRRYKLEKKTAKEEQRQVSAVWKQCRRKQSPERRQSRYAAGGGNITSPGRVQFEPARPRESFEYKRPSSQASIPTALGNPEFETRALYQPSEVASTTRTTDSADLEKCPAYTEKERWSMSEKGEGYEAGRRERQYPSSYDEAEYYKYGRMEEDDDFQYECVCCCGCSDWSRRRKCLVFGGIGLTVILTIVLIAVGVSLAHKGYAYTPSMAQVNNTEAFEDGGATHQSPSNTSDGDGAGQDVYTYYSGNASNFPSSDSWMSFDRMWSANLDTMLHSCSRLNEGPDNTNEIMQDIYDAIQNRANASYVDHRVILATILQESKGCVRVGATTSSGGVRNPGLMQSHDGHSYDPKYSRLSILAMVQDGTQGTKSGAGLVQNLNTYGNPYMAMRGYNSGYIPKSGDLSEKAGATACYVSDMANRLTGWVNAPNTCPGQ